MCVEATPYGPGADGARNGRFPAAGFVYMERHAAWSLEQATLAAGQPPTPPSMTKEMRKPDASWSSASGNFRTKSDVPIGTLHLRTSLVRRCSASIGRAFSG